MLGLSRCYPRRTLRRCGKSKAGVRPRPQLRTEFRSLSLAPTNGAPAHSHNPDDAARAGAAQRRRERYDRRCPPACRCAQPCSGSQHSARCMLAFPLDCDAVARSHSRQPLHPGHRYRKSRRHPRPTGRSRRRVVLKVSGSMHTLAMRRRVACPFAVKATYTRKLLDGRDEPAAPPHDRGHAGAKPVAGDAALLRARGRQIRPALQPGVDRQSHVQIS